MRPDALSVLAGEHELLVRLWEREHAAEPLVLMVDADDVDDQPEQALAGAVRRFVDTCSVPIVLACREPWRSLDRLGGVLDLARPLPREQESAWRQLLPASMPDLATDLSGQFDIGRAEIDRLARDAGLPVRGMAVPDDLGNRLWRHVDPTTGHSSRASRSASR